MSAVFAFGLILVLLVAVVVVSAVRERAIEPGEAEEEGPEGRLEAALAALRQLEFDRETGKLPEEEYRRLRGQHAREAVRARDEAEASGREGGGRDPESAAGGKSWPGEPGPPDREPCQECGARPPSEARFCAGCGTELPRP